MNSTVARMPSLEDVVKPISLLQRKRNVAKKNLQVKIGVSVLTCPTWPVAWYLRTENL